jgi:hypothetical protein
MNSNIKTREEWKAALEVLYSGREGIWNNKTVVLIREAFKDPADMAAALQLFLTFVYQEEDETIKDILLELADASLAVNPASICFSSMVILLVYQKDQTPILVNVVKEIKAEVAEAWITGKTVASNKFLNVHFPGILKDLNYPPGDERYCYPAFPARFHFSRPGGPGGHRAEPAFPEMAANYHTRRQGYFP